MHLLDRGIPMACTWFVVEIWLLRMLGYSSNDIHLKQEASIWKSLLNSLTDMITKAEDLIELKSNKNSIKIH